MKHPFPKSKSVSLDSALTLQQLALLCVIFGGLAVTLEAAQPSWWTARGAVNTALTRNDSAAVQEGQLKKITYEAVQEMNANLAGGAGSTLNSVASTWSNYYEVNGLSTNDDEAMKVGQLKYIASLVYPPLISAGYLASTPTWLHPNSLVDSNVANLGQLKEVFDFEIATPQTPTNLEVIQDGTAATLSWSDPVISVANFTILYSTNGGTTWLTYETVAGNTTSAPITGLILGTDYSFQVTASNPSGTSTPSSSDSAPIITLQTPFGATLVP